MSTLSDLVNEHCDNGAADIDWLHFLVSDWQLIADLAFADVILWVPTRDGSYVAVSHARPSSAPTLFYRDLVSTMMREEWVQQVNESYERAAIIESTEPAWFEEMPMKIRTIPVLRRVSINQTDSVGPIAVITAHTNLSDARMSSRLELAFTECANDLFVMIANGDFPDWGTPTGPRRGAPRASDGLLRLDVDGTITYASPNALSAFNRMGYIDEIEGESLAQITTGLIAGARTVDESLPVVVTGRAPWRTDFEANGVTLAIRAIPTRAGSSRTGALILTRDVSELRNQEQELITKDATIREIHHRVKNNLQTVASLLRIQARRARSEEAQEALGQAMRRVAAIAVVHDTLATGLSQNVNFDEVFDRVLMLVTEVASNHNTTAHPKKTGEFGVLPSEYATPLALALTELVTNAVEHGLAGQEGDVTIAADRNEERLAVSVIDTGSGLPEGQVGAGLGTQIVRTLIMGELSGTIDWQTVVGAGTEVTIEIPLRWLQRDGR